MEGRIKYVVLLALVLSLIYMQSPSVLYAGENAAGEMTGERTNVEKEIRADGTGTSGAEASADGTGNPGAETSADGTGNSGAEVSTGENASEDGTKPSEETEERPEPQKEIVKYEVSLPKPDGEEDYYRKKPEIRIRHISERGETHYTLKQGEKTLARGTLREKDEKAAIKAKELKEGKHLLRIWMTDDNGEAIEEEKDYEWKKTILVDTAGPEIHMTTPGGFGTWHGGDVVVSTVAEDSVSGASKISCMTDGERTGSADGERAVFSIRKQSRDGRAVDIVVTAQDRAGNKSVKSERLYIDRMAPTARITGVEPYSILGKTVCVACELEEENLLQEFSARLVWENVNGKKKNLAVSDWKQEGNKRVLHQTFKKDGIYRLTIRGTDLVGHSVEKSLQVIIDKKSPLIRYMDTLHGKHLKKLVWSYPLKRLIEDFTTCHYEIRLDGQLYSTEDAITQEGKHRMTIRAKDAAGNESYARADFVIDHTAPRIRITGAEEGKEYEETCSVQVEIDGGTDTNRKIQINGESQKIDSAGQSYQFSLHEYQDYVIVVTAGDRAGNYAKETRYFKIVPRKNLIEKIAKPMLEADGGKSQEIAGDHSNTENMGEQQEQESPKSEKPATILRTLAKAGKALGIGAVCLGILVTGFVIYLKREDAR